jgi:tetratricopeptide (TPR) repeat protein
MVSYRREDTQGTAGRIYDRLKARYGERSVFFDVDSVPYGRDFRHAIEHALSVSDALLAVVGPRWVGPSKRGRSRISRDEDHVRFEIETAIANKVLVIPVLVDGAAMPRRDQLPESLKDFPYLNAVTVDPGRDFHAHMDRLIDGINRQLEQPANLEAPEPEPLPAKAGRSEEPPAAASSGHAEPASSKPQASEGISWAAAAPPAPEVREAIGGRRNRWLAVTVAVTASLLVAAGLIFSLRDNKVANLPDKSAPATGLTRALTGEPAKTPGESQHVNLPDKTAPTAGPASNIVAEPAKAPGESKAFRDCVSAVAGFDQVIAFCKTAIESDKLSGNRLADALATRARAESGKGQRDFAIQDYDQAIKIRPNDAQLYKDRGLALDANRQFDRAIADFDQALKLNPADADALTYRRSTRLQMSPPSKAFRDCISGANADQVITDCTTVIEIEKPPGDRLADALAARGRAEAGKGQRDFAIRDYDQAIKINPNEPQSYRDRGIALAANRQFDRAIADFDQVLKLNPADADARTYRSAASAARLQSK